jgi:hypothetical protein
VRILKLLVFAAVSITSIASVAQAQATHAARVEVVVRDTGGRVLAGAEASVVQGLNEARAIGISDDRGRVTLTLPGVGSTRDDYQLVVRKIGYQRNERFFHVVRDSLTLDITLRRVPQDLEAVVVTAEQTLKRKSYHIDAETIASSDRMIMDATDIVAKLRPDMICGRNCRPMENLAAKTRSAFRACPGLVLQQKLTCPAEEQIQVVNTNVWVNGRRLRIVPLNDMAMARQTGMLAGLPAGTMSVLSEIRPEHIAEMTYVDDFDSSIGKNGSNGGLFIVLKDGVVYTPGKQSYISAEFAEPKPSARAAEPAIPAAYRLRVLGVFDAESGEPIEGAFVTDISSGTKARTTKTGTVSLAFLPEGATPLRISKDGYEDLTLGVEITPDVLTPITLAMTRRPKQQQQP